MISDLTEALMHTWQEPLQAAGVTLYPPLAALKIAGSRDVDRKVNFLIFSEGASSPACIAKVVRSASGTERLRQEFDRQRALYEQLPRHMPRPIGLFDLFGQAVLLEQAVSGQSLKSLLQQGKRRHPDETQADIKQVLDWLVQFQKQTHSGTSPLKAAVQLPIEMATRYADLLAEYGDTPVPLVASHGDFWAGNLFFEQNHLHVIDWEDFSSGKLPTQDALFFITTYALSFPWRGWGKKLSKATAFRRGFLERNWLSDSIQGLLSLYLDQLGLPPAILPLLMATFLHEMAAGEAHGHARRGLQNQWQQYLHIYLKD